MVAWFMFTLLICVRVLSLRSSVIHVFVTEPRHSRHVLFSRQRAASSALEPCALSSACLVSCWSMVFGSWQSCLEFRFRVWVQTLTLHVRSHCVSVRSRVSPCVLWCCTQFVFLSAACIHVVLCGTWLVFFIGCMLSCCHVLCKHVTYELPH